jgi:hypothetical protein
LTISNVIPANAGSYSVKVSNGAGSPVTSSNATLSVIGGISVDNVTSTNSGSAGGIRLTWSHIVGVGANGLLLVSVSTHGGTLVSSITCGGVALTRIGYIACPSGPHPDTEMWDLKSPTAGTNNIVVTLSSKDTFTAGAISFFGVNQTLPAIGFTTATGTADVPSVTVAASAGQIVVDSVAVHQATSGTNGSQQNFLWNQYTGRGAGDVWGCGSFQAGAASVSMSWTLSGTGPGEWASGATVLNPASSTLSVIGSSSVDNITSANIGTEGGTSLTWSHTTGVGLNRILLVSVSTHSGRTVSSITYGGTALTKIGSSISSSGPHPSTEMWYLKSPIVGAANIVVTLSGDDAFTAGATTFFGINQTTPFGNFTTNTGTAFMPSVTIASVAGQIVVDSVAAHQATSGTTGAGQMPLWNQFTGTGGGDVWGSSSFKAGTGTISMSWNLSGSGPGEWAATAVTLVPVISTTISGVSAAMNSSGFNVQFSAPIGSNVVIEASTDMVHWTPVVTNYISSGSVSFTDTSANLYPSRYYRAHTQ